MGFGASGAMFSPFFHRTSENSHPRNHFPGFPYLGLFRPHEYPLFSGSGQLGALLTRLATATVNTQLHRHYPREERNRPVKRMFENAARNVVSASRHMSAETACNSGRMRSCIAVLCLQRSLLSSCTSFANSVCISSTEARGEGLVQCKG